MGEDIVHSVHRIALRLLVDMGVQVRGDSNWEWPKISLASLKLAPDAFTKTMSLS